MAPSSMLMSLSQQVIEKQDTEGEADGVNIRLVVLLFMCMYGSIGGLWVLHKRSLIGGEHATRFRIVILCITWASTSVGMHVLNKSLVSALKAPAMISMVQMVFSVVAMVGTSFYKVFDVPRRQMMMWMVVPVFFAGMLCSSFYTYEYISLSMLTVVRNLTPLLALSVERHTMPEDKRPKITPPVIGALLIMLTGAVIYSNGVGGVSMLGIFFAMVNMGLALSDRLIQRRLLTTECQDMSSDVCTLVTNTMGIFPTLILAFGTSEISGVRHGEHAAAWSDPGVLFLLLLSGAVGLGIAYFGFECQRAISATAFFVLQNASKIVVVCFGVILFGDPVTATTMFGISMSIGGSFLYGHLQMQKSAEQEPLTKGEKSIA